MVFVSIIKKHTMKRIILLWIALAGIITVNSQHLVLSDDGTTLSPGATVTVNADAASPTVSKHLAITNNHTDTLRIKVKKVELNVLANTINTFCWVQCYSPTTYVSPDALALPGGGYTDLTSFVADYFPNGQEGTTALAFVFFDQANPSDSVLVYINFNTTISSIEDLMARGLLSFSNAYPNPAASSVSLDYKIPADVKNARLVVRNLLGSTVREIKVGSGSGKLNLNVADMVEGIYFYSFVINNQVATTKKLVIKR
jgi:hypothetical protein